MENDQSKKYIFICTGSDCKKRGSKKLAKTIAGKVKDANLKSSIEIISTKCMGNCKNAPNVIVDNCIYQNVREQDAEEILLVNK